MEYSKHKMQRYLQGVVKEMEFSRVFFALGTPLPPASLQCGPHPAPRLILPLSGEKEVVASIDGRIRRLRMLPGQVLFCVPGAWTKPLWEKPGETISVVYNEEMVRSLYINCAKHLPTPSGPDVYHHTATPLSTAGQHVIKALVSLASRPEERSGAAKLVEALLRLTLESQRHEQPVRKGKANFTWNMVNNYIRENWAGELSRQHVAKALRLHPNHLSRLVREHAGVSFKQLATREKMQHAEQYLRQSSYTIDEIAQLCGYAYTAYFIQVFRKHTSRSPGQFREECRRCQGTQELCTSTPDRQIPRSSHLC
jgi:AraC-like DNA-binding protein